MTRAEKQEVVEELTGILDQTDILYLADLAGLSANQNNNFRRLCFQNDIKLRVVKNTILNRAMETSSKDFGELTQVLKGSSTIIYGNQANQPARLIKSFRKRTKIPSLKGAYIHQAVFIGDEKLDVLEKLKSKEELLAEIVSLLQAPLNSVISGLQSGMQNLMGALETLANKES